MNDFFLNLVNISITAGWIVIAVMILRLFLKKAPKWINCVLWGIVGLRLIFPVSIESVFSLIPSKETINTHFYEVTPYIETGFSAVDIPLHDYMGDRYYEGVTVPTNLFSDITNVLSIIWIVGLVIMLAYALISFLKLHRKMRTSTPLRDNIRQSEFAESPFILGIIKPKIYLPYSLSEEETECIIKHEQSHLKRLDNLWKPLAFLILSVYWFNLLMWIAYILLCRDIELACDEKVINNMTKEEKQNYSVTLLKNSVSRKSIAACPLAFGEVGVRERIKSVMSYKKPTLWIIIAAVIAVIVTSVCFLTNPPTKPFKFKEISVHEATSIDMTENNEAFTFTENDIENLQFYLRKVRDVKEIHKREIKDETYTLKVTFNKNDSFTIYGYTDESDYILMVYNNKYYRIKNKDLDSYLNKVCINKNRAKSTAEVINLDEIVSKAVTEHYKNSLTGLINVESHVILANEQKTSAGNSDKAYEITVYAVVMRESYNIENNELSNCYGSVIPTALTFTVNENNNYSLKEYWEPRDGGYYAKDIEKKFPDSTQKEAIFFDSKELQKECYNKALAQMQKILGGKTSYQRINKLLNTIASSPENSATPKTNINAHPDEYKELLSYNNETLRFIYSEFLKGGQTDFRGKIMQEIMIDLLDGEAVKLHTDNGQEYFDAFLQHAKEIYSQKGNLNMEKFNPKAYMLLEMIGYKSTANPTDTSVDKISDIVPNLSNENLDKAVSSSIYEKYKSTKPDGLISAENHIILSSEYNNNNVTVYAMVYFAKYSPSDNLKNEINKVHQPMTFTFKIDGSYTLTEIWEPQSGAGYNKSIKDRFPDDIEDNALNKKKYEAEQKEACRKAAESSLSRIREQAG